MTKPFATVLQVGLLAALLTACVQPVAFTDKPMQRLDQDTEYVVEDRPEGFTLTIRYSRYQFIPTTDAVAIACRQALTAAAHWIAEERSKPIDPVNEQRIQLSTGRNGFSGMTSCTAMAPVDYR